MRKASIVKRAIRGKITNSTVKRVAKRPKATAKAHTSFKELRSGINLRRNGEQRIAKPSKSKNSVIVRIKPKGSFAARSYHREVSSTRKAQAKAKVPSVNTIRTASIKHYESAVRLLYAQDFEKAKLAFEKIIQTDKDDKEILERAKSHLKLCEQKIPKKQPNPRSVEDLYNLAITLMNNGEYQESMEHLNKALKHDPNCDYVLYALAAANCLTGNFDGALSNLKTAINLKPENRFLAQHDSDFEPLTQDSRFISIVYPGQGNTRHHLSKLN